MELHNATEASTQTGRQIVHRVARLPVEAGFEVQVVAGRGAGRADPADHFAPAYVLTDAHEYRRLMPVAGLQADAVDAAVADAGVVAVAAGPAGPDHPPEG